MRCRCTSKPRDLVNSPDRRRLDMGTAFTLIDGMCGQIPEGAPPGFKASGAYNMETRRFMVWDEYIRTVGQFGNPRFFWAVGPWQTFVGTCSLKPASAWVEHSYRSEGSWVWNGAKRPKASRESHIDIRLPGFSAETSMSSWRSRCENVDQMAETFRAMPELTDDLRTLWKGLDLREESVHSFTKSIQVPFRHEGQAVATTSVLVVKAHPVLNVERWYWYYEPGSSGISTGWQGMGELWNNVYTDLAWVEARGLAQQRPVDPMTPGTPDWWYCVNMARIPYLGKWTHSRIRFSLLLQPVLRQLCESLRFIANSVFFHRSESTPFCIALNPRLDHLDSVRSRNLLAFA